MSSVRGFRQAARACSTLTIAILAFATTPVAAEDPRSPTEIAGHYYLAGVMEVGSELVLAPDGRFQWMMAYGSVDQFAAGRWTSDGRSVILAISPESANDVRFRLGEKAPWERRAASFLESRREQEALAARARRCPLPSLSEEPRVTFPDGVSTDPPAPQPDTAALKADADRAHTVAQALLDRLKTGADWQHDQILVEDSQFAITEYQDKIAVLRGVLAATGAEDIDPVPFDLPRECRLSDWKSEVDGFRGVAIHVFDPELYQRGDGIEVEAHYDEGPVSRDIVRGGYAFFPLPQGKRITSITLHVPGADNDRTARLPVSLAEPSVQLVDANLGSLAEPPFSQLRLTIQADGSLRPEGELSQGLYRK